MNKFAFIPAAAILALAAGAAAPAMARDVAAKPAGAESPLKLRKPSVRYCFVSVDPRSQAEQRDCRTRTSWIQEEGIDPAQKW